MSNKIISTAALILMISGCATNQGIPSWYQSDSCYVSAINHEKEGVVNHLTICMKEDHKITASLRYPNQLPSGESSKPTTCFSKGLIKPQDTGDKVLIITEKGACTNGRSFNSFAIICESKNSESLLCRDNRFLKEINLTRVK